MRIFIIKNKLYLCAGVREARAFELIYWNLDIA